MPKIDHDTKEKILTAAEKVFHQNGFKGTRTTLIAQEAGISRTMLHYYFHSKEDLFHEVLKNTLGVVFMHLNGLMKQKLGFQDLLMHLIETLCNLLEEKPNLPSFLVNLLNESPEVALMLAGNSQDTMPFQLDTLLEAEKKQGTIDANLTGEDLVLTIYGLCSVAYLGWTYIKAKERRSEEDMKVFMRQRKEKIKTMVLQGIKP